MNDQYLHIDRGLNQSYPLPDIPANEAWAAMNSLLDENTPPPPPQKTPNGNNSLWKYGLIFLFITGILIWINRDKRHPALPPKSKMMINRQGMPNPGKSGVMLHPAEQSTSSRKVDQSVITRKNINPDPLSDSTPPSGNSFPSSGNSMPPPANAINPPVKRPAKKSNSDNIVSNNNRATATGPRRRNTSPGSRNTFPDGSSISRSRLSAVAGKSNVFPGRPRSLTGSQRPGPGSNISGMITPVTHSAGGMDSLRRIIEKGISKIKPSSAISSAPPAARKTTNTRKNNRAGISYGLQWNAPIPLQGTANYFSGTDGHSKPYNLLIPEIWVAKSLGKSSRHGIQLQINLNQQYYTGTKEIASSRGPLSPQDSSIIVVRTSKLVKISGFGAALQYNYTIDDRWSAAIGLNYSSYGKALLNKKTVRMTDNKTLSDTLYGITRSDTAWHYIKSGILTGKLELSYHIKKMQVGAAVYIPLTNMSTPPDKTIHPVNGQLFFRWRIK